MKSKNGKKYIKGYKKYVGLVKKCSGFVFAIPEVQGTKKGAKTIIEKKQTRLSQTKEKC